MPCVQSSETSSADGEVAESFYLNAKSMDLHRFNLAGNKSRLGAPKIDVVVDL